MWKLHFCYHKLIVSFISRITSFTFVMKLFEPLLREKNIMEMIDPICNQSVLIYTVIAVYGALFLNVPIIVHGFSLSILVVSNNGYW